MDNSAAFGGIRDGAKDRLVMPKSCGFYQIVSLILKFGAGQVGCELKSEVWLNLPQLETTVPSFSICFFISLLIHSFINFFVPSLFVHLLFCSFLYVSFVHFN